MTQERSSKTRRIWCNGQFIVFNRVLLTLQHSCWLRLEVLTFGSHLRRKQNKAEEDEDPHAENTVGSQLHRACLEAGRVGYVGYLSTSFFVSGSLCVSGASPGSLRFLMPSLSRSRRLYSGGRTRIAWETGTPSADLAIHPAPLPLASQGNSLFSTLGFASTTAQP